MNKRIFGYGASAGLLTYYLTQQSQYRSWQWQAAAEGKTNPYFSVGVTLNPMYEKRWKQGEDAYQILNRDSDNTQ